MRGAEAGSEMDWMSVGIIASQAEIWKLSLGRWISWLGKDVPVLITLRSLRWKSSSRRDLGIGDFSQPPLERHTRKSQGCALAVEPKAIFHCYKMVRPVHLKGSSKISWRAFKQKKSFLLSGTFSLLSCACCLVSPSTSKAGAGIVLTGTRR